MSAHPAAAGLPGLTGTQLVRGSTHTTSVMFKDYRFFFFLVILLLSDLCVSLDVKSNHPFVSF